MEYNILNWNVHGINSPAKRRAILIFLAEHQCNIIYIQEVKMQAISKAFVVEMLEPRFCDTFIYKPATGSKGGMLIARSSDLAITHEPLADGANSIIGQIMDKSNNDRWTIMDVYGPQDDVAKVLFIEEFKGLKQFALPCWMVLGDFNLIKKAKEKNDRNINLQMMGRFNSAVDDLELTEYPLLGRRFTWSNECDNVTVTKIDRILVSKDWDLKFPNYQLTLTTSSILDNYPLLLKPMHQRHFKGFQFESYWLKQDDFVDIVKQA